MKLSKSTNDIGLVVAVSILMTIGLIMVFSASAAVAHEQYGSVIYYLQKQIFWGFVAILSILLFSRIRLNIFATRSASLGGVFICSLLLLGLFILALLLTGPEGGIVSALPVFNHQNSPSWH